MGKPCDPRVPLIPTEQNMEALMQLGVGGIFAILVIREVLSFLQRRGDRNAIVDSTTKGECMTSEERKMLRQVHEWTRDLHNWHDVSDTDGVKIWYVRRSLEEAVDRLVTTIEKMSEFQRAEFEVLKEMARDMRDLRKQNPLQ